jgi:cell division protein FtsB
MLFFDQNNFFVQFNRFATLRNAKQQKAYYDTETKRMQQQITALTSDNQAIERYAREKYYMKKPNEDIFVFLQDKE